MFFHTDESANVFFILVFFSYWSLFQCFLYTGPDGWHKANWNSQVNVQQYKRMNNRVKQCVKLMTERNSQVNVQQYKRMNNRVNWCVIKLSVLSVYMCWKLFNYFLLYCWHCFKSVYSSRHGLTTHLVIPNFPAWSTDLIGARRIK